MLLPISEASELSANDFAISGVGTCTICRNGARIRLLKAACELFQY